ncbi:putative helicase [Hamiltosporidium magnivora]|uniref:Putative helicase n=1 Tax=Hamiltosporidium magnivora TaxID=148818 RepID=A0A4Q9KW17_9MICR|nr:putative helicase [Hamiltosporidium magnivora]
MDKEIAQTVKIIDIDEADAVLNLDGIELEHDFRTAKAFTLISTNKFSRGMDIIQVNLIINFDLPIVKGIPRVETYIHRVGRSGRFDRSGVRVDLVSDPNDLNAF